MRCSSGYPGYTVARAECAPEPYNLSAPRSRHRAKHSVCRFPSFVVNDQFMSHCRKVDSNSLLYTISSVFYAYTFQYMG